MEDKACIVPPTVNLMFFTFSPLPPKALLLFLSVSLIHNTHTHTVAQLEKEVVDLKQITEKLEERKILCE